MNPISPACLAACVFLASPAQAGPSTGLANTYVDIAEASYQDSLITARDLQAKIRALIAAPSEASLAAARAAWARARTPYMQTEVFRFANPIVDDWEGKVNAWPLDEGLIDYVAPGYFGAGENAQATLNVIATPEFTLSGKLVDAQTITPAFLATVLHEADENEANVATGYHAIEFLLWGQDLTGNAPGAGTRPYTDFVQGPDCTHGNCDRRVAYLTAATDLLIDDLEWMVAQWAPGGAARDRMIGAPETTTAAILTGIGSLSFGELAGQRLKLGLMLHDPEEEHDCFSDNTPESHHDDVLGMQNVSLGRYVRSDGTVVTGPALTDLVSAVDPDLDATLRKEIEATLAATDALRSAKAAGLSYDMMLAVGNQEGAAMITAVIDALVAQSRTIERISTVMQVSGVVVQGDETLGSAGDVFQ
jgi:putative iron-regulated protein